MPFFPPLSVRARVTLALTSIMTSILTMALLLDIAPSAEKETLRGRATLAQTIGYSALVQMGRDGDIEAFRALLEKTVEIDPDLSID